MSAHLALARAFVYILSNPNMRPEAVSLDELVHHGHPHGPLQAVRADLAATAFLLAKTLTAERGLLGRMSEECAVVAMTVPDDYVSALVVKILTKCVFAKYRADDADDTILVGPKGVQLSHEAVLETLNQGRNVFGIAVEQQRHLPATLLQAADCKLELAPLNAEVVAFAIEAATGSPPARPVESKALSGVELKDLSIVVRMGWTAEQCLARLKEGMAPVPDHSSKPRAVRIDDLHGFGAAKAWAHAAIKDMAAYKKGEILWEEFDNFGLLLSSPPGCGKTEFAAALAHAAEIPLIASSVAEWNSASYLHGTLKAIRATFDQARAAAPAVLFIDELDGISDRSRLTGEYVEYWTQIVNAVLEELTKENAGIIVLGATNFPDRIDSAIRRSGRLDRHIAVGLPTGEDLANIYRLHLGERAEGIDLIPIGMRSVGATGADVASWVKRAVGSARRQRRALTADDLVAAIDGDRKPLKPESRKRIAVHECGHVLAAAALGFREIGGTRITTKGGDAVIDLPLTGTSTVEEVDMHILVMLAGRAAERLVFGNIGIGSGHGPNSDMSRATDLACMIEGETGTGKLGMVHAGITSNYVLGHPLLLSAVRERLAGAETRAMELLDHHKSLLLEMASVLEHKGFLSPDEIAAITADLQERAMQ